MSRREIKACDTIADTGLCNREATGTCPLCEKDFCASHASGDLVEVSVGIRPQGQRYNDSGGGWITVQCCMTCTSSLRSQLAGRNQLVAILPTEKQIVEALRALLAAGAMKGTAG